MIPSNKKKLLPSFVLLLISNHAKKMPQIDISIFQLCLLLKMRLSVDLEGRYTGYKSRKQIMMSFDSSKKRMKLTQDKTGDGIPSEFHSFFGRIWDFIICF
jgi:hypothetical protein